MPYGGNKKNNHISKRLNKKTFYSTHIKKGRYSFLKKQNNQRDLRRKAKKHLEEYKYYNRRLNKGQEKDKSIKGMSMKLMEIIEEMNEKGINDNNYLISMNLLMELHNYQEKKERRQYTLPSFTSTSPYQNLYQYTGIRETFNTIELPRHQRTIFQHSTTMSASYMTSNDESSN